ncbi:MAG: C1 family peptidase [Anaerolineae bacterium]
MEAAAQPSSFDWRDEDKVTSVKNQSPCGLCWAFGTTSVLESAVLAGETTTGEPDFSEQSVGLCVDRSWIYLYDQWDEPCATEQGHGGGTIFMASEVFIRKGAVWETCNLYDPSTLQCDGACACDSCPAVKVVDGVRLVTDDGSQINVIKNAVYNEGPVAVSYFHDPAYEYSDPTWGTIFDYYPNPDEANHCVSIVGWDDDVPHPNPSHSGTGAWIVKNSWGTGWGDNGYFYLTYDSGNAGEVILLRYKEPDHTEELLYWDEAGPINAVGYGHETAWMASVFTAPQDRAITHVDFWTTSSNAEYEIHVWDGSFGRERVHQPGSCQEFGYYSVPLSTPIAVPTGEQFTVGVKMTTPGFDYPIPVEHEISGSVNPPVQSDVSFVRRAVGDSWDDLAGLGYNASLRARMAEVEDAPPNVPNNPSPATGATGVSTTAQLSWTGGDPDLADTVTYDVYFGTSSPPPLEVSVGPYPATQTTLAYDPGSLEYNTHYFWSIVATDAYGASSEGETWYFTTADSANEPPTISGLPDQEVPMNGSAVGAIDLWAYANDAEDADDELTFAIVNVPAPGAGVTIDSNRYIDINPEFDWTGDTQVEIQVADTDEMTGSDSFRVTVRAYTVYLPLVMRRRLPMPGAPVSNPTVSSHGY